MNPGRVAIVSGAGGGIGSAIAGGLAEDGNAVAVLDLDGARAEAVAETIARRGGRALAFACDVSDEAAVAQALALARAGLGDAAVLVHAAGIGGPFHRADEVSVEEWERVFATNVRGAFLLTRALLPSMAARGFGRIVHIASIQGLLGARLSSTYVASKHAVVGYARAVAVEWAEHGITCNAVCPGYVETRMGAQPEARPGHRERILARTPARRLAEPTEIAALVRFLVSEDARHVNGAAIVADGGITADVGI